MKEGDDDAECISIADDGVDRFLLTMIKPRKYVRKYLSESIFGKYCAVLLRLFVSYMLTAFMYDH